MEYNVWKYKYSLLSNKSTISLLSYVESNTTNHSLIPENQAHEILIHALFHTFVLVRSGIQITMTN